MLKIILLTLIVSGTTLLISCSQKEDPKDTDKEYRLEPLTVSETKMLQNVFVAGVLCGRQCGQNGLSAEEAKTISIKALSEAGYQIFPPDKEADKKKNP